MPVVGYQKNGSRIKLPKIGWVRMREELRYTGKIRKVVVSKRDRRWFVSILVRCCYQEGISL